MLRFVFKTNLQLLRKKHLAKKEHPGKISQSILFRMSHVPRRSEFLINDAKGIVKSAIVINCKKIKVLELLHWKLLFL